MDGSMLGIAIADRTDERRLLTRDECFALDEISEARGEFFGLAVDPATGEPEAAELEEFGFTSGGPRVIRGEMVEVEPGMFQALDDETKNSAKHWFER